jgi:poly(hydroxyalkanoate) granule-associated protein
MATQTSNTTGITRLGDVPRGLIRQGRNLVGTGRNVFRAYVGAVAKVGEQGSELYNTLVERGERAERRGMEQVRTVRKELMARQQAIGDRIESTIAEPAMAAMRRFGVPTRGEVRALSANVATLSSKVDALVARLNDVQKGRRRRAHLKDRTVQDKISYHA